MRICGELCVVFLAASAAVSFVSIALGWRFYGPAGLVYAALAGGAFATALARDLLRSG